MYVEHQIDNVIQSPHINIIIDVLYKVGSILRRDFHEIRHVPFEKRDVFVDRYKKRSTDLMVNILHEKRPDYGIVTRDCEYQEEAHTKWIINPLSGAENFLRNIGEFCCSIAVKYGDDVLTSVILDPIKQDIFYADENRGAFLNHKKIYFSKNIYPEKSLFGINSGMNSTELRYRKLGSPLLNFAYVCSGKLDGCIEKRGHLCDYAGAIPLITETRALYDLSEKYIVCSNEKLNEHLMKYFNNNVRNAA